MPAVRLLSGMSSSSVPPIPALPFPGVGGQRRGTGMSLGMASLPWDIQALATHGSTVRPQLGVGGRDEDTAQGTLGCVQPRRPAFSEL